jgi:hypothetical protein
MERIILYRRRIIAGVSLVLAVIVLAVVVGCGDIDMWNTVWDLSTKDPEWKNEEEIMAGDGAPGDGFGCAVAIHGDYAIVGASNVQSDRGAAYLYHRDDNNTWEYMDKLTASGTREMGDFYGESVAIYGEYVAVGAPGRPAGDASGAVFIYHISGLSYEEVTVLEDSIELDNDDRFGVSIGLSNTYLIAGAPGDDTRGGNAGCVYFFNTGTWSYKDKESLEGSTGWQFGSSVGITDKMAVAGAPLSANTGSAFTINYVNGNWQYPVMLDATGLAVDDSFGSSVAIDENYVIAGGNQGIGGNGFVKIFSFDKTWNETTINAPADDNVNFGFAVDMYGVYAVIGDNDYGSSNTGAVYFYKRKKANEWEFEKSFFINGMRDNEWLGTSVAIHLDKALAGAVGSDKNYDIDPNTDEGGVVPFSLK